MVVDDDCVYSGATPEAVWAGCSTRERHIVVLRFACVVESICAVYVCSKMRMSFRMNLLTRYVLTTQKTLNFPRVSLRNILYIISRDSSLVHCWDPQGMFHGLAAPSEKPQADVRTSLLLLLHISGIAHCSTSYLHTSVDMPSSHSYRTEQLSHLSYLQVVQSGRDSRNRRTNMTIC